MNQPKSSAGKIYDDLPELLCFKFRTIRPSSIGNHPSMGSPNRPKGSSMLPGPSFRCPRRYNALFGLEAGEGPPKGEIVAIFLGDQK